MPIYINYEGIQGDVTAEGQDAAAGSLDPEYRYVNIRRLAATGEGEGDGTSGADLFVGLDGIEGASGEDRASQSGGGGGAGKVHYSDLGTWMPATGGTVLAPQVEAPPGTGKTLAAELLGQRADAGSREDGPGLAADGADPAALDHAVTVLAWARVDGQSPSSIDPAPGGVGRDVLVGGMGVDQAAFEPTFSGGITVAAGDAGAADDVVVDGRVITAQNPVGAAAHELGHTLGFRHEHTRPAADDDAAATDIIVAAGAGGGPHVKASGGTDGDADVDGRDFLIWQRGGSAGAVGSDDLAAWRQNYGSGGAASPGGADDDLLVGGLTAFGDASGDVVPTDQFSLNFGRVDFPAAMDGTGGIVQVGLGDGSVRFVSAGIDPF